MWTARIVLLVLLFLTGGGWFDAQLPKWKKTALLCTLPIVFALSYVPTIMEPSVRLCPAPFAMILFAALLCPTDHPFGALLGALLGGGLGWELCETFPLFFEQGILIAFSTLVVCLFFCRDANAKALAVAAAPFVMLVCRMAGDYMLFRSTVLELGNGDALCAQTAGCLLLLTGEFMRDRLRRRQRRTRVPVKLIPRM